MIPLVEGEPDLILVAADVDMAAERITAYLAKKNISISVVTFSYAVTGDGREILARTVSTPQSQKETSNSRGRPTLGDLLKVAAARGVLTKFEILRSIARTRDWGEELLWANGCSSRYWVAVDRGKVLLGVNLGGEKFSSQYGELDVWIWPDVAAAYSKYSTEEIERGLEAFEQVHRSRRIVIRLNTDEDAQRLLNLLKDWDSRSDEYQIKQQAEGKV